MRNIIRTFLMLAVFAGFASQVAYGQTARKFGKKAITVRLCPTKCTKVTGHGYKPGATTTVYETRGGWARVSGYIKRSELVKSFGTKITKKPALWVPVSSLTAVKKKVATKKKPATKKKVAKKRTVKKRRVARLSRTPVPIFRPNSAFVASAPAVVSEPVVAEPTVVEQSVPEPAREPVVEVVESTPAAPTTQETGSKGALTWEQVQAKIAAQKNGANTNSAAATAKVAAAMKAAAAKKAVDAAKVAETTKAAAAKKAAKVAAAKKATEAAKVAAAKKATDGAKVAADKKVADAAKAVAAKKTADVATKAAATKKAAVAAKAAADKKTADAAKVTVAKKTTDVSEEQRIANIIAKNKAARIAAEAARKAKTPKVADTTKPAVGYQPPKPDDTKVAAVLPPEEVTPKETTTPKASTSEPVYKSADADPISFGKRPKKYTKALRDKRLRKLPGSKSGVRKDVIIALRHYALGLLKSGECKGIAKGGASTVPGMLYVICSDDPTYLRQFPLKEETW